MVQSYETRRENLIRRGVVKFVTLRRNSGEGWLGLWGGYCGNIYSNSPLPLIF